MVLRPFLNDAGSCASYLFGCTSHSRLAVVDPQGDLVDDADAFAHELLADGPPRPAEQERIVAANRSGVVAAPV
jgi:hypothetical protein